MNGRTKQRYALVRASSRIYGEDPISLLIAELSLAGLSTPAVQQNVESITGRLVSRSQVSHARRYHEAWLSSYRDGESSYAQTAVKQARLAWTRGS